MRTEGFLATNMRTMSFIYLAIVLTANLFLRCRADLPIWPTINAFLQTAEDVTRQTIDMGDTEFHYLVVGGGTAGLAMANRLSENPHVRVAVIEAGTYYQMSNALLSSTPAADVMFAGSWWSDTNPLVDWNFITEPQKGCNNRQLHYPRGLCLGGSSARNFMIYQRGTKQSYQKWADEVGDQSYTFDNFLPYFKKSVKFTPPSSLRDANASVLYNPAAYKPTGGPLQISYANYAQPFSAYLQGALEQIGISRAQDFNSGYLEGGQYCTSTINPENENRDSSETSYLAAAQNRANLKVFLLTKAKRIIFDKKKAVGVLVVGTNMVPTVLTARREVILSAGAFQSPQLLMVSGVGPEDVLKKFNIPVVADLPGVGQGMQDHVFMGPVYRVKVDTLTKLATVPPYFATQLVNYTVFNNGPLTNPVCDYIAWEKVSKSTPAEFTAEARKNLTKFPDDWPEIEYLSAPGYVGDFGSLFAQQPRDGFDYATILVALVAPMSRGTVTIISSDTNDLPRIDPNWLVHPTDQQVAVAGFKRAREAFKTEFMSGILADTEEYFPGEDVQTYQQILDAIKNFVFTVYHASCTCRMGKKSDKFAVVDSQARVFGTQSLRVVDASSFPFLPPGHPQSTIYALAEKIAAGMQKGK